MTEVKCPYCGNEFEDENFEQDYLSDIEAECPRCEKIFCIMFLFQLMQKMLER